MRIAVVNTMAPFAWGGAEELAHHLIINLRQLGHSAELYRIPFAWEPFSGFREKWPAQRHCASRDLDRVISMKFPVYLLEAERHLTWLIYQYRQAYDLWDSPYCNIPHSPEGEAVRELIIDHDNQALRAREGLFTISNEISGRLERFNEIRRRPSVHLSMTPNSSPVAIMTAIFLRQAGSILRSGKACWWRLWRD